MLESLFYAGLVVFILLGMVSALYALLLRLTTPKNAGLYLLVIPAHIAESDLECLLRSVPMRTRLLGRRACAGTLVVDCGMGEPERALCEMICRELGDMTVCGMEEAGDWIAQYAANGELPDCKEEESAV